VIGSALTLTLLGSAGCDGAIFPHVRRILMKVTFAVGDEERIGSAIYELRYGRTYMQGFDASGYYSMHAWGQAPFILVEDNFAVFALLTPPEMMTGFNVFKTAAILKQYTPPALTGYDVFRYVMDLKGEHEVPREYWPITMYFADPHNFLSAQLLPAGGAKIAGKDVYLRRVSLMQTADPTTHKLNAGVLPSFDGSNIRPNFGAIDPSLPMSDRPFSERLLGKNFILKGGTP
jgi:hypothetical protein